MKKFIPFADNTASQSGYDVTVENGTERLNIYGDFTITRDKAGLAKTRMLLALLRDAEQSMAADHGLPDAVAAEPRPEDAPSVPNPFG